MVETPVVAILGGSSAWTPVLASALADRGGELPALEVRLLGRDLDRTATVARFCAAHAQARGVGHAWHAAGDLREAVRGVAIVVNQMRIGGFAGRAEDERLPLAYDLPGDETIGPGGLSAAVRSARSTLAVASRVAALAPECRFVNMANPMSILLRVLAAGTPLRCLGLCELPATTLAAGLRRLGLAADAATSVDHVGLNHQAFLCRVEVEGRDVVPAMLDAIERDQATTGGVLPEFQIAAAAMRRFAAVPLPYLRLHLHREGALAAARRGSRAARLDDLARRLHRHYAVNQSGELPALARERATPWLDLALAPALSALLGGSAATLYVSERNGDHLPFLPADAIVEKRARVDAHGVMPLPLGETSLGHERRNVLLQAIAAFERAAASAALAPTPARLREALALHPSGLDAIGVRQLAADIFAAHAHPTATTEASS